ncbi:MAG: D-alanine--D-alanine ligase [Paenibacillaceae bacterium]
MSTKIRIGILYGGKSGEHLVSIQTALSVINAFDFNKYDIVPFYISQQGQWGTGALISAPVEQELLQTLGVTKTFTSTADSVQQSVSSLSSTAIAPLFEQDQGQIDLIIPLLHGTNGEDGTIQGLLEIANIPYVGAGVLASAVGMDKVMMKYIFAQVGLPQCMYRHFTKSEWHKDQAEYIMEIEVTLGYPCFVKPANLGSSVGISKANNQSELLAAVTEAFRYDRKVIVEEFVDAREIEVGILGNDNPKASVCGEVVSSSDFYDYNAKYVDGTSAMVIPADIPNPTSDLIRSMAVRAFKAIDGTGLSRVDFFLQKSDGSILINEINTMPGFTPFSMYPLLWQESGKSYSELLDELIRLALERHAAKQDINYGADVQ